MWRDAHVSRVSRCAYSGKPPGNYGANPPSFSSLSRLARLLGGGGRPERTGLAACRHLFVAITPHSAAPHRFAGKVGRSGASAFWTRASNGSASPWRSASWREGAWKGPATIGPPILVRRAPTQGRTNPRKSSKAHACPGRVGITQPEPGNCGSR